MAQEVGGHHPVVARQRANQRPPGLRTPGDAVQQQDDLALTLIQVGDPFAVQVEVTHISEHVHFYFGQVRRSSNLITLCYGSQQ